MADVGLVLQPEHHRIQPGGPQLAEVGDDSLREVGQKPVGVSAVFRIVGKTRSKTTQPVEGILPLGSEVGSAAFPKGSR